MVDYTYSQMGAANNDGGTYIKDNALFQKIFTGMTMAAFATKNVTMGRHEVKTIQHGKSASFAVMGKTTADYYVPGTEITGGKIKHNEIVIPINGKLLSKVFIDELEEAKLHYGVRAHYSNELGTALSNQMDRHVLQTGIQAALTTTPNITAGAGDKGFVGSTIDNASIVSGSTAKDKADALVDSILQAAQTLDEKDIPNEGRTCYLSPSEYYLLVNNSKALDINYGNNGNGSISKGNVIKIGDVELVMTNQLPKTNVTTGVEAGDAEARHAVDARNTKALVMHRSAVGTVKLMDLATESKYLLTRQGTMFVAKYAVGHGVLRPESAVLIRDAAPV